MKTFVFFFKALCDKCICLNTTLSRSSSSTHGLSIIFVSQIGLNASPSDMTADWRNATEFVRRSENVMFVSTDIYRYGLQRRQCVKDVNVLHCVHVVKNT